MDARRIEDLRDALHVIYAMTSGAEDESDPRLASAHVVAQEALAVDDRRRSAHVLKGAQ